ncbi:MAG: endonuclease/exonuclease/phosphatase family protein [Salinivirgaceae bacterium]
MKKTLSIILLVLNSLAATGIILAYVSTGISPEKVFWLPFFGILYPAFLAVNVFFVVFWLWRKKWVFLLSLVVILIGYSDIKSVFAFNLSGNDKIGSGSPVKVLSYNVRVFDLYNWSENTETRNRIFNYIIHQNADIICFQEFFNDKTNRFTTLDSLIKFQKAREVHAEYTVTNKGIHQFGIATFSKYPVLNQGSIKFPNTNNIAIFTDVKVLNDTVRIYNNHLQSNQFSPADYQILENIEWHNSDGSWFRIQPLLRKMAVAYKKRAHQANVISDHIRQSPYPVIVCGDFNDSPVSYTYRKMRGDLNDAFLNSGFGLGNTIVRTFPSFRIDYIFHDKRIKSSNFKRDNVEFSDHYPIHALLYLP